MPWGYGSDLGRDEIKMPEQTCPPRNRHLYRQGSGPQSDNSAGPIIIIGALVLSPLIAWALIKIF